VQLPTFNWVSAIYSMDCPIFNIKVLNGITTLMRAYKTIADVSTSPRLLASFLCCAVLGWE